jgi:hypothetical protein
MMATVMVMSILSMTALSVSAADLCSKVADREAYRQYREETTPLFTALKGKHIELSEATAFGISETLATQTPDISKINALESDIKTLQNKIETAATKYGIAACCRNS